MTFTKESLTLYAVTDRAWEGKYTLYQQVEQALEGGVTMVQLREKNLPLDQLVKQAAQLAALCHRYGAPLIINDCPQAVLPSGADGVHVGLEDCPPVEIRKKYGNELIVGATAKTVQQAVEAEAAGANYLGVGAVFPSPTKPNAIRITANQLADICSSVKIPCVAIGGITLSNLPELRGGGMSGIAVVSAVFSADDITAAARQLKSEVSKII